MLSTLTVNAAYLAWADTKARYKKSVLGPFWIVFTNIIFIAGLSSIWAGLLKLPLHEFAPTLAIGLIVWQLISSVLSDAPSAFIRESLMIRNVSLPIWFFALRLLARHVITFAHNLLIIAFVIWYFDLPVGWSGIPNAVLALLLVLANLFWLINLLGLLGARFRDLAMAIQSLLPLLFFASPVLYEANKLPATEMLIRANPLSYFIEGIRAPLLGSETYPHTLQILILMLVVGSLICFYAMRTHGRRIAFWV